MPIKIELSPVAIRYIWDDIDAQIERLDLKFDIKIKKSNTNLALQSLIDNECDLAVVVRNPKLIPTEEYEGIIVGEDSLVLCVPANHPFFKGEKSIDIKKLNGYLSKNFDEYIFLIREDGSETRNMIINYFGESLNKTTTKEINKNSKIIRDIARSYQYDIKKIGIVSSKEAEYTAPNKVKLITITDMPRRLFIIVKKRQNANTEIDVFWKFLTNLANPVTTVSTILDNIESEYDRLLTDKEISTGIESYILIAYCYLDSKSTIHYSIRLRNSHDRGHIKRVQIHTEPWPDPVFPKNNKWFFQLLQSNKTIKLDDVRAGLTYKHIEENIRELTTKIERRTKVKRGLILLIEVIVLPIVGTIIVELIRLYLL